MAQIDSDASEIIIRLVYDGPPEAGKTTSLRALAGSLSQPAYTPAEDADGRTLWFDWMEYVGGRFEGCRIRCQIVSVPGQRKLAARRRRVLEGADVVVFVADSAQRETPRTLTYLRELHEMLAGAAAPIGVILQANKRDLPDAIPLDELRTHLGEQGWPIGVVESVAANGTGIREAFVYAVRLALDRVRELMSRGALHAGSSSGDAAADLLEALRADDRTLRRLPPVIESGALSPAARLLREVLDYEHASRTAFASPLSSISAPRPPDAAVPSGAIWPPVEGRAILSELAQVTLAPRRLSTGAWAAGLGTGWRVVAGRDSVFASLDQGRTALIQWARQHAGSAGAISSRRCIVLADDGDRGWRLWQIVRADESLRELFERALDELSGQPLITRLSQLAQQLLEAYERLAAMSVALPCDLDAVGASELGAVYIGLMPDPGAPPTEPRLRNDPRALLHSQLDAAIASDLRDRGVDLANVLARLPVRRQEPESIAQAVSAILVAR